VRRMPFITTRTVSSAVGGRRLVAVPAVDMGDRGDPAAERAGLQPGVRIYREEIY
jgi:hypothetical protein